MKDRQPSRHQDKSNQKSKQNFGKNKASFDQVMACYRSCQYTGVEASDYSRTRSSTPNYARATGTDLRIDVSLCIKKIVPAAKMARFNAAYCFYDSENPLEQEIVAEKVFGVKRHRTEQKLGAEFIKRGIYPISGYFQSTRHSIDEWKNSVGTNVRHERLQEVVVGDDSLPVQPTLPESESVADDAALNELLNAAFEYEVSQGGAPGGILTL